MANTGIKGIDVRQTSSKLVFRAALKDAVGAKLTSGTTTLALYELQDDGTLKSYDFNDNTFKTTALTTATLAMTHRTGNNSTVDTGIWTASLSTLSGFTAGAVYFAVVINSGASPAQQEREWQFGGDQGDIVVTSGRPEVDVKALGGGTQSATDLKDFADTGYDPATHKLEEVKVLTGHTPQTGDAYARLGAPAGASIAADIATRASSTEVTSIQNNTRVVRVVPTVIERPDSGTVTYRIELLLYDSVGNMEAPDSAPTIALVNQSGTDRSSRLDSTTMALVSTGRYRAVYTADVADTLEQLVWAFSVVEGGATRLYGNQSLIVDTTAVDFTAADRTKLETLATDYTTARAAKIDNLDATVSSRLATVGYTAPPAAATVAAAVRDVNNSAPAAGSLGEAVRGADAKAAEIKILIGTPDASVSADIAAVATAIDDIVAAIAELNDLDADTVKAQLQALLFSDANDEPVAVPAANAPIGTKMAWNFVRARNKQKLNKDTGVKTIYADNGTTPIGTGTDSDDGDEFTSGKVA